jgi:hypothetical protein
MTAPNPRIFDLDSCRDLLGKLERELVRLEYSLDRFDRADHAANFAIWAWRLTAWVYAEIAARAPLRRRFAESCGTSVESFDLDRFQAYVEGRQGCPALACCRAIAMAARDAESGDPPASAVVVPLRPAGGGRRDVKLTEWRAPQWLLSAGDGAEAVPDIELCQTVLQFWTDFIHANHIA